MFSHLNWKFVFQKRVPCVLKFSFYPNKLANKKISVFGFSLIFFSNNFSKNSSHRCNKIEKFSPWILTLNTVLRAHIYHNFLLQTIEWLAGHSLIWTQMSNQLGQWIRLLLLHPSFVWYNISYYMFYKMLTSSFFFSPKGGWTNMEKWVCHSKMVIFCYMWGSMGANQEPKHIHPTACTPWRLLKPNKVCYSHEWGVRSPLKGRSCERMRIFSNILSLFGLKPEVVNTRGWHRNGGDRNYFYFVSRQNIALQINSALVRVQEMNPTPIKSHFFRQRKPVTSSSSFQVIIFQKILYQIASF